MPWSHTAPLDQQTPFIAAALRDRLSMPELGEFDGVRRKTGSTGLDRDLTHGPPGLEERSRRPRTSPRPTPDAVVAAILAARPRPPSWGAKQRVALRSTRPPRWPWPARATVCDLLSRQGLVPTQRQRRALGQPGKPIRQLGAPNEVWSADFTGHVKTADGRYGSPRTSAHGDRRVLRSCHARASTSVAEAQPVVTRVFNAFGRPTRIRPAPGGPCATNTRARLSQWSAWWVRRGIVPACLAPGKPPQTGRHERRPRPLTADTTRPPAANRRAQQRQCHHFRAAGPEERPPEALDLRPPAAGEEPSPRPRPNTRPPLASPDRVEGRDVSANGGRRWHHPWGNVSTTCAGAYGGLAEIDDGVWHVSCGPLTRGRLLER